jgi:hypothetical protein
MIPGLGDEKGSVSQNPMIRILQSENEQNHKTIHETKKTEVNISIIIQPIHET